MYVTTHSKPREDWCEWWTKMAANLNVFKTSKKDCILFKSNFSFAEVRWAIYRIRYENKNFDDMGTLKRNCVLNLVLLPSIYTFKNIANKLFLPLKVFHIIDDAQIEKYEIRNSPPQKNFYNKSINYFTWLVVFVSLSFFR